MKRHASEDDLTKLASYVDEICGLVTYNTAASKGTTSGNPWQLIWVFDGDSSTNVVCEGYAKAFQYLCDLSDFKSDKVRSFLVTGIMAGGVGAGSHMWNSVIMEDGRSYLVDVTNCDQAAVGKNKELFLAVPYEGSRLTGYTLNANGHRISYNYDSATAELYESDILDYSMTVYPGKEPDEGKGGKTSSGSSNTNPVTKVTFSALSNRIAAGKKLQITATVKPDSATNKKLIWTSSNPQLATVNQKGLVQVGKSAGGKIVVITAMAADGSGKKAVWRIRVMKGAVKKITIKGAKSTLKTGHSVSLKAAVKAGKGANKILSWSTSNKKYATVSATGKVKAQKAGKGKKVTIKARATDGSGVKKSVTIRIR